MTDYRVAIPKVRRLLKLLSDGATGTELEAQLGFSSATLSRYIRVLRDDAECAIEYDRAAKRYRLTDSGAFK